MILLVPAESVMYRVPTEVQKHNSMISNVDSMTV